VDIDECADGTVRCDTSPSAGCVNTMGGFRCTCPLGYSGDGRGEAGCIDVDECTLGADDCDDVPAATCSNVGGGFACACPSRYVERDAGRRAVL
jgi:hypothetical protein